MVFSFTVCSQGYRLGRKTHTELPVGHLLSKFHTEKSIKMNGLCQGDIEPFLEYW